MQLVQRAKRTIKRRRRQLGQLRRQQVYSSALVSSLKDKTILYESYAGNSAICHPEAVFRELLQNDDFHDYTHVWVTDDTARGESYITATYGVRSNVRFVRRMSLEYYRTLARAKYLINNVTFPSDFVKRHDQVYVNTWHGTPIKKMGFDRPNGRVDVRNTLRNLLSADYLISSSPYMTDVMYRKAHKLEGIYKGSILELGSPRIDRQYLAADEKVAATDYLRSKDVQYDDTKRTIIYAPTWRGSNITSADLLEHELLEVAGALKDLRATHDIQFFIKVHQSLYERAHDNEELRAMLIPNEIPPNVILALADALICDYSSIILDYCRMKKPIYRYLPDSEEYERNLGAYFDPEELPGAICKTVSELRSAIARDFGETAGQSYLADQRHLSAIDRFTPLDDGQASKRLINAVFYGDETHKISLESEHKQRLLMYIGGFAPNGITASGISLLNALDPDQYDITLLVPEFKDRARQAELRALPAHIRTITYLGAFVRQSGASVHSWNSLRRKLKSGAPRGFSQRDMAVAHIDSQRIFGNSTFDVALDFGGYGTYWAMLIASVNAAKKAVWMHSDFEAEVEAFFAGRRPGAKSLIEMFEIYEYYDCLVSVSPVLADINRKYLASRVPARKFTWIPNTVNMKAFRSQISRGTSCTVQGSGDEECSFGTSITGHAYILREMIEACGEESVISEVHSQITLMRALAKKRDSGGFTFIAAGRMSPEKNYARLIEAFAIVHAKDPDARLIIMGQGDELGNLIALAKELGIRHAITFPGYVAKPFALFREADCFVMSSDHEGQPMVFLEARLAGLPIVSTKFRAISGALTPAEGEIVEPDVDALASGMLKALRGEVPVAPLDGDGYNAKVLHRFHSVLFAAPAGANG